MWRRAISVSAFVLALHGWAGAATLHAPGGGTIRALIMGIDEYTNLPRKAWLHGAAADAIDIGQALAAVGVKVAPLVDAQVVRSRVVAEMDRLVDQSKRGDFVIVSFSGHGMRVPEYPRWKGIDPSGANSQIVLANYGPRGTGPHDVIVDKEMRAWLTRFDAKGVDVLLVMDACYGGNMRQAIQESGQLTIRTLTPGNELANQASFVAIPMNEREARANVREMAHVTFLAGATASTVVPEMTGVDARDPTKPRGVLSYFVARAIEGGASKGHDVTRRTLFGYALQNVKERSNERQDVDLEPRIDDAAVMGRVVLRFGDDPAPDPTPPRPPESQLGNPVRVGIANGGESSLEKVVKGRASFVHSPIAEADLVWDPRGAAAFSRGDRVMEHVDGAVLGGVIDRTWAIREIQKLSPERVLQVQLRDGGKLYTVGDSPQLVVDGLAGQYLTVINIAADGTVQHLFPVYASHNPHMGASQWTYDPVVGVPFGADHVVAIATSQPATQLLAWLNVHNLKRDAADLVPIIANTLAADPKAQLGTVGLYTAASSAVSSGGK